MIGMSIKRISVLNLCHVLKSFVKSTPGTQIPRYSQDEGYTNSNGLLLLDFCRQTGLRIMNGGVGNDEGVGKYMFVGSRGSS